MSALSAWSEEARQAARDAGMTDAQIDATEAGVLEHRTMQAQAAETARVQVEESLAAIQQEAEWRHQQETLDQALEMYTDGTHAPAAIAAWVVETAGENEAAAEFVQTWQADERELAPQNSDEWLRERLAERQAAEAQLDRVAETVRQGLADAEQRRRAEHADGIAQGFVEKHPDAADVVGLLLPEVAANVRPGVDPTELLEGAYAKATVKDRLGEDAVFHAAQSQPFASTVRAQGWMTKETMPTAESLTAERVASIEAKAEQLYDAHADQVVESLAAPRPTRKQESEAEAERFAALSAPRFGGGLEFPGGPKTGAEQRLESEVARQANPRAVVERLEAGSGFGSATADAETRAVEARAGRAAGDITPAPEPVSRRATATTPRSWWDHLDEE